MLFIKNKHIICVYVSDIMKAMDPLINLIPKDLHSNYMADVVKIASQLTTVRFGSLTLPHDVIMVAVTKPQY